MVDNGFVQSKADYFLFTRHSGSSFLALLVYVDDIILANSNLQAVSDFKQVINDRFKIKDLGPLMFFLGLEVACSSKGISICQRKFALDVLTSSSLTCYRPAKTPME